MTPAPNHLAGQAQDPFVRDPVLEELLQPAPIKVAEEVADVRIKHPVHLLAGDPDRERVQRIVRAASGSEPVREPDEVRLVDRVEHLHDGTLEDLVLQRRDAKRS
jgi:predicted P-loop ATPase/GTPase